MERRTKEPIHKEHGARSAKPWSELWSENPGARAERTRTKDAVEKIKKDVEKTKPLRRQSL